MKARRFTFILFLCLAAYGCADDVSKAPDKGEISQIQESDKDYCAIHNWYDDGVCDEFCINPDPDCADQCRAVPTCGPNEVEVEECSNEGSCNEVSVCGQTILCEEPRVFCPGLAVACGPDQNQVEWCDTDEPGCTVYSDNCGGPDIYCFEDIGTCGAVPTCPDFTHEVDGCHDQTQCHRISECSSTILCQQDTEHCEATPSCPNDYVQVEQCPLDTECQTEFFCGYKAICMPDPDCTAVPSCPEGSTEVVEGQCLDPDCFVEYACGQAVYCRIARLGCRPNPSCDEDEYHVSAQTCAQTTECRTDVRCSQATHCMPVPHDCNDLIGAPPACAPDQTPTTKDDCTFSDLNSGVCEATFGGGGQCNEYIYCRN